MRYSKIEQSKNSVYSKYKLRVGHKGSGEEYTKSYHMTKAQADKAKADYDRVVKKKGFKV